MSFELPDEKKRGVAQLSGDIGNGLGRFPFCDIICGKGQAEE